MKVICNRHESTGEKKEGNQLGEYLFLKVVNVLTEPILGKIL